jgi:RNA polymerase sigma-B factor
MTDEFLIGSTSSPADPEVDTDVIDVTVDPDDEANPADDLNDPDVAGAIAPAKRLGSRWSDEDRARERELLSIVHDSKRSDAERTVARNELVTLHLPLVNFLARRFRDRGEPLDDLIQVGTIGLINAVDRFDAERGFEFSSFATPTIIGEIKRHFRDKGWAIRVPRRAQELRMMLNQATVELTQSTGRSPNVRELAAHLKITEEEVIDGIEAAAAYSTTSLDAHVGNDEDASTIADFMGDDDPDLGNVEDREALRPLLAALPARERQILGKRFFQGMTQGQIAEELNISQMHVSRLLAKSLATLREGMLAD